LKTFSDSIDWLPRKDQIYVYWVVRFLKYCQNGPSKPLAHVVFSYLKARETYSRFARWQAKQAADAILLYAHKYLKSKPCQQTMGLAMAIPLEKLGPPPMSGKVLRHYIQPSTVQRMIKESLRKSELPMAASCHLLRHSYATHLMEAKYNIRMI